MLIERKEYLDKLLAWKDKQLIKVITGVRRCGKSTLMEMFQSHLKRKGVEEKRILSVNFEDYDFYDLRDPAKLYAYIKERFDPNAMNYIFLDEVQHVADFPRVVDSLYIKKNIDLYLTGSNAYMLQHCRTWQKVCGLSAEQFFPVYAGIARQCERNQNLSRRNLQYRGREGHRRAQKNIRYADAGERDALSVR